MLGCEREGLEPTLPVNIHCFGLAGLVLSVLGIADAFVGGFFIALSVGVVDVIDDDDDKQFVSVGRILLLCLVFLGGGRVYLIPWTDGRLIIVIYFENS